MNIVLLVVAGILALCAYFEFTKPGPCPQCGRELNPELFPHPEAPYCPWCKWSKKRG